MKIVFVGRPTNFNRGIVSWLANDHELAACLFVEHELFTLKGVLNRIRARRRRYGALKALNEMAFHAFYLLFFRNRDFALLDVHAKDFTRDEVSCPSYVVHDVNAPEWIDFIRARNADMILSVCTTLRFDPQLLASTRLGTFIVHDGITPEYRGLHTVLWALMKREPQGLGCTLLRANSQMDAGDVVTQHGYTPGPGESFKTWSTVTHRGILANLPYLREALKRVEQDNGFTPLNTAGRTVGYYTWMGLTEFVQLYFKHHVRIGKVWRQWIDKGLKRFPL